MTAARLPSIGAMVLLLAVSASGQVDTEPGTISSTRMLLPPVFGIAMPGNGLDRQPVGNSLSYGFIVTPGYNNNVLPDQGLHPIADTTYALHPLVSLHQQGSRMVQELTYSPGFTLYQHTTALDDFDQHLSESLQDRLSENMVISVQEDLEKSSNAFSQTSNATNPGLPALPITGAVAPYADQLSNTAVLGLLNQFRENDLVGATGSSGLLDYLNPAQSLGLANTTSLGASGFYLHRFAVRNDLGAVYQFNHLLVSPKNLPQIHIQLNAIAGSYTFYFSRSALVSFTAGPQRTQLTDSALPQYGNWKPFLQANIGWRGERGGFTGFYSESTTSGSGLQGVFQTETIGITGRWQPTIDWSFGGSGGYNDNRPETSFFSALGGHGYSFSFLTIRRLSEYWNLQFEYDHLDQRYTGIAAIAGNPTSDRETISLSYAIKRHLGQ